jgi:phosphatidylglycerol:prolipoprotein diacylglycerol transferase
VYPRLLTTPLFTIHTFGALLALAYAASYWWLIRDGRRHGTNVDALGDLAFWAIAGAIVGAKALLLLREPPGSLAEVFSRATLTSAGDFYGGFLGALAACAIFFQRDRRLDFWRAADLCAPAIALGQAIGRVGCFMAGDDYGRPTNVAWAVTFTDPEAAAIGGVPLNVPLHPVQLYESIACFALFLLLLALRRRRRQPGDMILTYTIGYAMARFVLEFFRGDADRGFIFDGWLSTSQFIALVLIAVVIVMWALRSGSRKALTEQ